MSHYWTVVQQCIQFDYAKSKTPGRGHSDFDSGL